MAQYRAIFNNAYFKGLATAAVVTVGLAAGQAQAGAAITQDSDAAGTITIDGTENTALTITATPSGKDKFAQTDFIIEAGETTANKIAGSAAAVEFQGKNLTINTKNAQHGLAITGDASDTKTATVTFQDIAINKGTIALTGAKGGEATLNAKSISLEGATTNDANLTVGANTIAGYDLKGNGIDGQATTSGNKNVTDYTALVIGQNANVKATASADAATVVNAADFKINGGAFTVAQGGTGTDSVALNIVKGELDKGTITTVASGALSINFADDKFDTAKTFNIKEGKLALAEELTFNGEGKVLVNTEDGKVTVEGDKGITIGAKASIAPASVEEATKIAGKLPLTIGANGTLDLGTSALDLTSDNTIKLGTSADKTQKQIKITDATSVVKASSITLGKDLTATLKADTLVIKGEGDNAVELENANLVAKNNLVIDAKTTLKNDLKLGEESIAEINESASFKALTKDEDKIAALLKPTGTISKGANTNSSLTVENDKTLTIANGTWTNDVDLTLGTESSGGSLTVGAEDSGDAKSAAKLTFDSKSKLNLTQGTIIVGKASTTKLLQATLDLSDLKASNFVIGDQKDSTMTAEKNGTIVLSEKIAEKILAAENTKLKTIIGAGGTLKVAGDLDLTKDDIVSGAGEASKIAFSGDGATLEAQNIKVSGLSSALDIGQGVIKAENLKLDNKSGANYDDVTLSSGTFIANKGLSSTQAGKKLTLGKDSIVVLGDVKSESAGGTTNFNLLVSATSSAGEIKVENGNWTGKDVTLTQSGNFTIGGVDLGDEKFSVASFKSNDGTLTITDTSSTVTVAKGSELGFDTYKQASGALTVKGTAAFTQAVQENGTITVSGDGNLTLAGKVVEGEEAEGVKPITSYGVETKDGTITVDGSKASLTLGATALKAITGFTAEDKIQYAEGLTTADPFKNNVTLSNFGTLVLDFANKQDLTVAQINALRSEFLTTPDTNAGYLKLSNVSVSDAGVTHNADKNRYEITHDNLQKIDDLQNVDIENLANATVTGIESDPVSGVVGNLEAKGSNSEITIAGATLNKGENGFAKNESGSDVDLSINQNGFLHLKNGGSAANISLADGTDADNTTKLIITDGKNTIAGVNGGANSVLDINGNANVSITKDVEIGSISTDANTVLNVKGDLSTVDNVKNVFAGALNVSGDTTFNGAVELKGKTVLGDVSFAKGATISNNATLGNATFAKNSAITSGITSAKSVTLAQGTELVVGQDIVAETLPNGSSASLVTKKLELAGGSIFVDPSYAIPSSIVVAEDLTNAAQADPDTDAGTLGGAAVALQNSVFAVGVDSADKVKSALAPLFNDKGALVEDKVGAVAYIAKTVTLGATDKLVVDSTRGFKAYNDDPVTDKAIYLGKNSALAVDASAFESTQAPITLENGSKVYAGKDAKVILTGADVANKAEGKQLFAVNGGTGSLTLEGYIASGATAPSLTVQTINGWFTDELTTLTDTLGLELDAKKAKQDLSVVSSPIKDTLLSAAYDYINYEEYEAAKKKGDAAVTEFKKKHAQYVLGDVAVGYTYDKKSGKFKDAEGNILEGEKLAKANIDEDHSKNGTVYFNAHNELLENIIFGNGNPVDAETVARLAVFGGAPQAALEAGSATYGAIASRMGIGANSGVTLASNTQGGALWVTPVYKNADYDGFNADDKSYGSEVNLYGVALGADFAVAPNFTVGAMFNVGSGDADGQGLGSNVSNDFNYYGFGLYAGYSMDAFSLVGDVTYTTVDNDLEGNTSLGKATTSIDSTNLSVGVTGQYKLALAGMDVTPHAGIRFSTIEIDDYSLEDASYSSDKLNVFSVPVGVTFAKDYAVDAWTLKPSFDLTLTGNFGDDEAEGTVDWAGYSNLTTDVKSEIIDNFTYGAAFGFSATNGNFGLGIGLNYTGSSNTDSFGVNANARYMF